MGHVFKKKRVNHERVGVVSGGRNRSKEGSLLERAREQSLKGEVRQIVFRLHRKPRNGFGDSGKAVFSDKVFLS